MERVAMYLRKSRADLEAESRGEGETLAKHKKALMRTAKQLGLNIVRIREEIVSGESLFHRPEMNELLREVEAGEYDAVLVMDIDRLGRGDMQEQGLILNTFRASDTKIITPSKTYDLKDESDELMTEIQTVFARQELRTITRRMQRGRVQSVEAGNYIATRPPYGWSIKKEGKSRWLEPHPEQFAVMNMIFEWYTHDDPEERMGTNKIANELNSLGFKSYTGKPWTHTSVLVILKNKANIGFIEWKKKEHKKTATGRVVKSRDPKDVTTAVGKHNKYITDEMRIRFEKAQEILNGKYHVPYQLENGITNPLAGLVRCDKCGMSMILRPYVGQPPHIKCYNTQCDNKSSRFEFVEEKIINSLEDWLYEYEIEWSKHKRSKPTDSAVELKELAVNALSKELKDLEAQKLRLHDLLERGIYDEETYLDRSANLADRIAVTNEGIAKAQRELEEEKKRLTAQKDIIPKIKQVLKLYRKTDDPAKQNALLKSILHHATYRKEKTQRLDNFTLKIYPKRIN